MNTDPLPGARVTWDDDDPGNPVGTVEAAPQTELDYVATCTSTYRIYVQNHCAWVRWDGSDRGAWTVVEDLRAIEGAQP